MAIRQLSRKAAGMERYHVIGGYLRLDPEGTVTSYADAQRALAALQAQVQAKDAEIAELKEKGRLFCCETCHTDKWIKCEKGDPLAIESWSGEVQSWWKCGYCALTRDNARLRECMEKAHAYIRDHRHGKAQAMLFDGLEKWKQTALAEGQAHIPDASNMAYAETVESVTTWANETFGQATVYAQIQRAKQELDELLELMVVEDGRTDNGKKLAEEAADVCICLYRVIGTLDPEAINKKMAINRARKWKVDGHGCAQHVKEPS